jgi:hypothetical protein
VLLDMNNAGLDWSLIIHVVETIVCINLVHASFIAPHKNHPFNSLFSLFCKCFCGYIDERVSVARIGYFTFYAGKVDTSV